jgi:hypothetical protein
MLANALTDAAPINGRLDRAVVPCGGCTACCRRDLIALFPEHGDDVASYETEPAVDPRNGREVTVLKRRPDGACIYLGEDGCTIHARAPAICRVFDCRRFYLRLSRVSRRAGLRTGLLGRDVIEAGRERLKTLPEVRADVRGQT